MSASRYLEMMLRFAREPVWHWSRWSEPIVYSNEGIV